MNNRYRRTIIAGNWKMNKTASEVKPFADELRAAVPKVPKGVDAVLCVPFPLIPAMRKATKGSRIATGAQDVSEHELGAYTGEVSAEMLRDLDVKYCVVGHSERRAYVNETDGQVGRKLSALLGVGITPILCVGETLEQRQMVLTMEIVAYQVKAALYGIPEELLRKVVVAYEPIWAIGTGSTASAEQAEEVCAYIRGVLRSIANARVARSVSILYGGSMNLKNAEELLAQPDIDGGLIGGASLDPQSFAGIIGVVSDE
jgi:triosephosphate isomerase